MGIFGRLRESLSRTKQQLVDRFEDLVRRADAPASRDRPLDLDTVEALEELLVSADVGVAAAERIVSGVQASAGRSQGLRALLKDEIVGIFEGLSSGPDRRSERADGARPRVILVVGVNGTGKTTTVAKLAHLAKSEGEDPLICAADTFRAAATEQLEIWAGRAGVDIVRARHGADPAAVVFDAIAASRARNRSPVIVDTAGRLHTRVNLMQELEKIRRVASREVDGAPHDVLLVLDATVGQNGLAQAREFVAAAGVNGIVLAKLDGTAKGGIAVAIAHELRLPIEFVGVGEQIQDLVRFSAREYVDALFDERW
jgi:fused signal recognition particle receptor